MKILDWLMVRSFMKLFVVSMLATPPLFILGELTEDLDDFVDRGLAISDVAVGFLYQFPQYLAFSFPIAALIATVFTIHGMTTHREVVAAKAGGISFHRLIAPVLLLGFVLTGAALALTEMAPRTNRVAFSILQNEPLGRQWRTDFVFQTESGLTVAAERLDAVEGSMRRVLVQEPGTAAVGEAAADTAGGAVSDPRPALWIQAETATWEDDGWTLLAGTVNRITGPGEIETERFERMPLERVTEGPEDLLQEPPEHEEMTYGQMQRQAELVERSGGDADELWVKREQKLAIPVATLVIILFGAPLATSSRRGGTAFGIGVALGTTILYLVLFRIAGAVGASGAVSPVVAAWAPNALFLVAGLFLLARVRT